MTQEDKYLLLRDLCARLPYGVIVHYDMSADPCWDDDPIGDDNLRGFSCGSFELDCADGISVENIKPYLRPMSSMTEDEKDECLKCIEEDCDIVIEAIKREEYSGGGFHKMDFLLSHNFDFRGLIPMGLALEAKEGMYNK